MKTDRWEMLRKRIKNEAKHTLRNNYNDGVAIISVHMIVRYDGVPILWIMQDGKRVEPSTDAIEVIEALIKGLS